MPRSAAAAPAPLKTLVATRRGKPVPLPPKLARLYGSHLYLRYSFAGEQA